MQKILKNNISFILSIFLCLSAGLSIVGAVYKNSNGVSADNLVSVNASELNERKVLDFNTGWFFSKGEGYNNSLSSSENVEHVVIIENGSVDENSKHVYDVGYTTNNWEAVSLPHTYNDVDTFDTFNESLTGSQASGASVSQNGERTLYSGTAWYKKYFFIPSEWSDKELIVEFEGARQAASVWVNGQRLDGNSLNGFVAFGYDISSKIVAGQTNEITVLVDNSYPYCLTVNDNNTSDSADDYVETMFDADYSIYSNEGTYGIDETTTVANGGENIVNPLVWHDSHWQPNYGGLYRNSNLYVTNKLQLTLPLYSFMQTQGTYVYTTNEDGEQKTAKVNIESEVRNNTAETKTFTVLYQIYNADGEKVGSATKSASLTAGQTNVVSAYINLTNVIRWSDVYPYQYTCYCSIWTGTQTNATLIDHNTTQFGIRTYRFTTDGGFYLNENYTYLHGWGQKSTNEWAGIGAAYSDWMHDFTISQMKEAGANYLRYGHTAAGQTQITACDKYGILVTQPGVDGEGPYSSGSPVPYANKMAYTNVSYEVRANAFRDMIIQFRNNPSIISWEIGNKDVDKVWDSATSSYVEDSTWADLMIGYINQYDKGNRNSNGKVDNVGTKATTTSTSHRVVMQRGDADSSYYDVFESTMGSVASNKVNVEGEYNRIEARRGVGDLYIDGFQNFKNSYVSGQQADYELSTSESFAVEQITSYYENVRAKGPSMMGGANWIYSDSVSHSRLLSEVSRASGEVDGTFLEKEAYYVNQVIFNNDIKTYIIGNWNYPTGTEKTVYVAAKNAMSVALCVDWDDNGTQRTDIYDGVASCDGMLYTFANVEYKPGTIRTVVKNSSNVVVENAASCKTTTKDAVKLSITKVNTLPLLANGGDYLILDVELLDEDNRRVTTDKYITYNADGSFALTPSKQVHFVLDGDEGTSEWIGGYNSFLENTIGSNNGTYSLYIEAGIIRVAIRTTSVAGKIKLTANMNGVSAASIEVNSLPVQDISGSLSNPYNLVAKQSNRLVYSLQSIHEPSYGSVASEGSTIGQTTMVSTLISSAEIISGGTDFAFSILSKSAKAFIDEDIVFTSVPEKYLTAEFLQAQSTNYSIREDSPYIVYTPAKPCKLLILINNLLTTLPSWMENYSFEKTGDIVIDSNGIIYDLYMSETLIQGANYSIGGNIANNNKTMFIPAFFVDTDQIGALYEETFEDENQTLNTTTGSGTSVEITEVTDSGSTTKNALKFVDKSASYGSISGSNFALFEKEFATQTGIFTFEFDFWMADATPVGSGENSENLPNRYIRIVFQEGEAGGHFDSSGEKAGVRLFIDNATTNTAGLTSGRVAYRNKKSNEATDDIFLQKDDASQFIPLNTWVTFKLEINVVSKQYKMFVTIDDIEYPLLYDAGETDEDLITYNQDITKLDHMIIASGGTSAGTFAVANLRITKTYNNLVENIKVDDVPITNFHEATHYYYVTKPNGSLYTESEIESAVVKMKLFNSEESVVSPIIDKERGLITVVAQNGDIEERYYLIFNNTAYYPRLNGNYIQDLYSVQSPDAMTISTLKQGVQAYTNLSNNITIQEYSNCYMGADLIVNSNSFNNNAIGVNNLSFVAPIETILIMFLPFDHNAAYPWMTANGFTKTNNFIVLSNGEKYIAYEKVLTNDEASGNVKIDFVFDLNTFNNKLPIIAAISVADFGEIRKGNESLDFSSSETNLFPSEMGTVEYSPTTSPSTDLYVKVADNSTAPTIITSDSQKALHLHDNSTSDGAFVYLPIEEKTSNFTISADFYINSISSNDDNKFVRFFLQSDANSGITNNKTDKTGIDHTLTHIYFSAGNVICYTYTTNIYGGTNKTLATNVVPLGEWFTATYEIDFLTKTFILKFIQNGEVIWTSDYDAETEGTQPCPFTCPDEAGTQVKLIQISTGMSGKQDVYVKNIDVEYVRTNSISNLKYDNVDIPYFDESGSVYAISLNDENNFNVDNFSAIPGTAYNNLTATGLSATLDASGSFANLTYNYETGKNINYKVYIIGNKTKLSNKMHDIDYSSLQYLNYTQESWDEFILKYVSAQNVLTDYSTNYLSLETAYQDLNNAFNNLDVKESVSVETVQNGSFESNINLSSIIEGDEIVITFNPNEGYSFEDVEIEGLTIYDLTGNVLSFTMPDAIIVITPSYVIKTYTITWKNDDGTVLLVNNDVEYGTMPAYTGETPTKPRDVQYTYTFSSWTPTVVLVERDQIYTAVYTSILVAYTITFDANMEGVTNPENKVVDINAKFDLPTVSKVGFKFIGWKISSQEEIYPAGAEFTASNNFSLIGKWIVVLTTSTTPEIEIEDENIDAGGILKNTARLIVVKVEKSNSSYNQISETIGSNADFIAYDITIENSADEVLEGELDSPVILKIKIPEEFNTERVKVYRVDESSKTECEITKIENGFAFINANHFSVYVVAQTPIDNDEPLPPSTDESFPTLLIIAISGGVVVVVGIIITIIAIKKKKKK